MATIIAPQPIASHRSIFSRIYPSSSSSASTSSATSRSATPPGCRDSLVRLRQDQHQEQKQASMTVANPPSYIASTHGSQVALVDDEPLPESPAHASEGSTAASDAAAAAKPTRSLFNIFKFSSAGSGSAAEGIDTKNYRYRYNYRYPKHGAAASSSTEVSCFDFNATWPACTERVKRGSADAVPFGRAERYGNL